MSSGYGTASENGSAMGQTLVERYSARALIVSRTSVRFSLLDHPARISRDVSRRTRAVALVMSNSAREEGLFEATMTAPAGRAGGSGSVTCPLTRCFAL